MSLLKAIILNCALVVFGIIIALILLEAGLRLYYFESLSYLPEVNFRQFNKNLGWRLIPNKLGSVQTLDYTIREKINSKGLRDVEHDYDKEAGVFRVVVLGDSFMEAYQVPLEDSFTRVLEKKLNTLTKKKFEVINMGVGGYGTAQEYLYFLQEGTRYKPDLVILYFDPMDVRNNSKFLESQTWSSYDPKVVARPFFYLTDNGDLQLETFNITAAQESFKWLEQISLQKRLDKKFLDKVLLYKIVADRLKSLNFFHKPWRDPDLLYGIYYPDYSSAWLEAWQITEEIILELKKAVKSNKAQFILVAGTATIELNENYRERIFDISRINWKKLNFAKPSEILYNFSKENNINYLALLPSFANYKKQTGKYLHYFQDDRHWNKEGHKLAAEEVFNYLVKNNLILTE